MSPLSQLVAACDGSVEVTANDHRSYYMTIRARIEETKLWRLAACIPEERSKTEAAIAAMEAADCCVEVNARLNDPSFPEVFGANANDVVRCALAMRGWDKPTGDDKTLGRLAQLIAACEASVHVTVNGHRAVHFSVDGGPIQTSQTIREYIEDHGAMACGAPPEEVAEIRAQILLMEAADRCVEVQAYPNTPIGFHWACGADIDETIARVLAMVTGGGS